VKMKKLVRSLLGITLLCSANVWAAVCEKAPSPYEATYAGSYKGWRIETIQKLEKDSQSKVWHMSVLADNFIGEILEESSFVFKDGAVQSKSYLYQRNVLSRKRSQALDFDWKKNLVVASGKKSAEIALKGGELDRLNHQLLIQCDLRAGKESFAYQVVDKDELELFEYQLIGEEKLETKLGKLDTVILRRKREDDDRVTTIWFAKDLDFAMVKLLQEEKKDAEAYLLYIENIEK